MFFSVIQCVLLKKYLPLRVQSHIASIYRKRTSQSASKKEGALAEDGGVTLEAAIIIPLLLCSFLGILMWGKVFLVHEQMETALLETARQVARQEALLTLKGQEGTAILGASLLFSGNCKQGDKIGGIEISSVSLIESEYRKETKEIYLKAEYVVKIPLMLLGTWKIPLKTSVCQKAWNGYAPRLSENGEGEYVYITQYGTSYHQSSQCYHLHVTIKEVEDVELYYKDNTSYRPCEFCVSGKKDKDRLYISEDGECYHEDDHCGGLSRSVSYVELEQTGGRSPCKDCCGDG